MTVEYALQTHISDRDGQWSKRDSRVPRQRTTHSALCKPGEGAGSDQLRKIAPITGDEQVALGIVVSSEAVRDDQHNVIEVRDSDETFITSIPLAENRDMNQLDQADHPVLASAEGEVYAVVVGPPPVHGVLTASLVTSEGQQLATETIRFNCYSNEGSLP